MTRASRRLALAAVFSSSLGVGLIFGFEPPLIALILSRGGSSSFAVGAVTAVSLLAVILLGSSYPLAISRLGLKRCVMAGVGCSALLLLLMPLHVSVGLWFVLRFLTGCAFGLSWIASEVWLNSISGAQARGTIMGIYGTVFSAGVMAGPALLEFTGTRGWPPFVIGAGCLVLTLLPLVVLRKVESAAQVFIPLVKLGPTIAGAPVVMLAAFVAGLLEATELTLLPLFGIHAGFDDQKALLLVTVFMAGNVALQVPIGLLADRVGIRVILGACALVSTIGPWLLQPWLATPLLWPLLFLWGGTLYAFYSQGVALLGGEFEPAELAAANTLYVMFYCLGGVVGPSVGGIAMDQWPRVGLQVALSGAAFCLLVGLNLQAGRARPRVP
jgi:MFS family permease